MRGFLIQMSGAPGSGKSTMAKLLAQAINGVVIDHDLIKSFLLEDASFEKASQQTYRFQWVLAEDLMKYGRSVIIDSTCNYEETLSQGINLAQRYNYSYQYVECSTKDIDLLEKRLQTRVPQRSQRMGINKPPQDAHCAVSYEASRALFEKWIENPCRPAKGAIIVDSTGESEKLLEYILKQIDYPRDSLTSNDLKTDGGFAVAAKGAPHHPHAKGVNEVSGFDSTSKVVLNGTGKLVTNGVNGAGDNGEKTINEKTVANLAGAPMFSSNCLAVMGDVKSARSGVIVPALTAVSTAEAVMMEGYVPIIVDVDPKTWMLSPEAAARAVSERTAAIITVDWLGTLCDIRPFRKLADDHNIKLISDSAQSFGATNDKPLAIDLADATIYSTGFPKVFHTGGSGGIVVCSTTEAKWLEQEPSGILRHEALFELNAYLGLRALDQLPQDLATRSAAAKTFHSLLRDTPGITFQHVAPTSATNNYQISITVDSKEFGIDAKTLSAALQAENVLASADRMLCIGIMPRLLRRGKAADTLPVSRQLGENSITLPIFNHITPETCRRISSCVIAIQRQPDIIASNKNNPLPKPAQRGQGSITDIAEKFHGYWVLPITVEGTSLSEHWSVLVKRNHLAERQISIDELLRRILSRREWSQGDIVMDDIVVHAKLSETLLIVSPRAKDSSQPNNSVLLDESGSSANVSLVFGKNSIEVHKKCSHEGIDGNGRPWLERQVQFFQSSVAVRETNLFIEPLWHKITDGAVSISFPYVPSRSLAEMALAGMGADSVLKVVGELLGDMAVNVWPKGNVSGLETFIEQAHFSRMRRRIEIARAAVPQLDEVVNYDSIILNGRSLLGFERVLEALSKHPTIKAIVPRKLGEIHGDLNLHNILCNLAPGAERSVLLIDPRGVPLLDGYSNKSLEPGDYTYDLSKLKFSFSGFSEIRKGFYTLQGEGKSFEFHFKDHPGSITLHNGDTEFFANFACNERLMRWVEEAEPSGFHSLELRVLLGEAAHYVADSACALGRDTKEEVMPLFLMGLEKLNDVLERIEGKGKLSMRESIPGIELQSDTADNISNYGVSAIQSAVLNSSPLWNVLEVLIKSESADVAYQLIRELVGECLPEGTGVHVSTHATDQVKFPCVLIHPFVGVRGQSHATLSSIRRTHEFLKDGGLAEESIIKMKVVTITSTGASTRSQFVSRENDKLLAPGPWGLSPLRLIVLGANQLIFPRPGRWIVENDSFFILSEELQPGGDSLCLLTSKRGTTGSNSPWRVCIDSTHENGGRKFAKSFREIGPHETNTPFLRSTNAIFLPNDLGISISKMEQDYAARTSPLLIDFVLSRFMCREDWIKLCCKQGFGVASDVAWRNARKIAALFPRVELAHGGDEMVFHHFGSDAEYTNLVDGAGGDPLFRSLALLPSTVKWLRNYKKQAGRVSKEA